MAGTLTGGKRDRMILESVLRAIEAELTTLGWFGSNRGHAPIKLIDAFPSESEEVDVNTIAFSYGDSYTELGELGSKMEEHYAPIFVDFFAESEALGRHVIGDIYAFLQTTPVIDIYDYDQVTPSVDFQAHVVEDSVRKRLPTRATNPWQKHWHILLFTIRDERANQ